MRPQSVIQETSKSNLYSPGTVMAHIVIEVSPRPSRAVGHSAAHLVSGGPHHLRVVAYILQVVSRVAVREVLVLKEPRLDCEEPTKFNMNIHFWTLVQITIK